MDELTPGVYDCPQTLERGDDFTIHPTAVETPRGVLLVDVGFPGQLGTVESHLAERSHALDDVWAVLCTHQDGDHVAGLADVVERVDPLVLAHRDCAPYVDGREHPVKSDEGDRYPPVDVDLELAGGETLRTDAGPVEVVFTPGHAPGHVSLFVREAGLLVAADALTADADGLAGPSERHTLEMDEALDSAAALANLPVESVHCHHGGHVAADSEILRMVVDERQ